VGSSTLESGGGARRTGYSDSCRYMRCTTVARL